MSKARANTPLEADPSALDAGEAAALRAAFKVTLPPFKEGEPPFEGPLDLLLHLVKEHQVDLFDIPIAKITEHYLATLELMRELDIDVAAEFLHMAAQLALMKSKLLLPRTEVAQDAADASAEGPDPRAELVRRLLEYQKYKAAGEELGRHDILDRDVFARRARPEPIQLEGPEGLAEVSVFKLIEALDRALANAKPEVKHEVVLDRLSITDAIGKIADRLRAERRVSFFALLVPPEGGPPPRASIIATFLALLEMTRLKLVRIFQPEVDEAGPGADILVEAKDTLGDGGLDATVDYR